MRSAIEGCLEKVEAVENVGEVGAGLAIYHPSSSRVRRSALELPCTPGGRLVTVRLVDIGRTWSDLVLLCEYAPQCVLQGLQCCSSLPEFLVELYELKAPMKDLCGHNEMAGLPHRNGLILR
jgi:hypothetical protein